MLAPVIEYTAPALVVDPTLAAPVVDVPPEGVERAQPAPVAEDVAPAPEIPCPAPTPVADLTDTGSSLCGTCSRGRVCRPTWGSPRPSPPK